MFDWHHPHMSYERQRDLQREAEQRRLVNVVRGQQASDGYIRPSVTWLRRRLWAWRWQQIAARNPLHNPKLNPQVARNIKSLSFADR